MTTVSLEQISREQPYPDFADRWPMGEEFLAFMFDRDCGRVAEAGQ